MDSLGISQEAMMAKMNQDPEVIELLSKPDVQQAMMSIQQNPNDTMKFVSNPDVVKLLEKMHSWIPDI